MTKPTLCVANAAHGTAYAVTATGIRLHRCELVAQNDFFQKSLVKALEEFDALPLKERMPGAVQVPDRGPIDPQRVVAQGPPAGALVIRVYNRQLGRTAKGELRHTVAEDYLPALRDPALGVVATTDATALFTQPSNDYMWVTQDECQAMMPAQPARGQRVEVPPSLCQRIFRFHLDPGRGLTESDAFPEVTASAGQLRLTVEAVSETEVRLHLDGFATLHNPRRHLLTYQPPSVKKFSQSPVTLDYKPRLHGRLAYDPTKKAFTQFDVVALGNVRGRPVDGNLLGERVGETHLLGIAFELVTEPRPADFLSPKGLRAGGGHYDLNRYLGLPK